MLWLIVNWLFSCCIFDDYGCFSCAVLFKCRARPDQCAATVQHWNKAAENRRCAGFLRFASSWWLILEMFIKQNQFNGNPQKQKLSTFVSRILRCGFFYALNWTAFSSWNHLENSAGRLNQYGFWIWIHDADIFFSIEAKLHPPMHTARRRDFQVHAFFISRLCFLFGA